MKPMNMNDCTDPSAMADCVMTTPQKTMEGGYNMPGLPKPPAGYGRVIGFTDSVDGDDMGPESPDEY